MYISSEQKKKCHAIIHSASASAGATGAGLAQVPLSDNAIITPIQITMIVSIGAVLGIKLTKSAATSILGTIATSTVGRGVSQVLLGWIPGVGNAVNATTAAAITEAAGWATVKYFENLSYEEERKFQSAKEEGRKEAKAEYERELNKINQNIKKAAETIREYESLEYFYMGAFAIGIAAANIDDNISDDERKMLDSLIVGLGYDVLPERIKINIRKLFNNKPTFNEAIKIIENVDKDYWDIYDNIIYVVMAIDSNDSEKKSAFKYAWNIKYKAA